MKHHWNWPFAILIYIAAHSTITAQPPTPRYVASTDFNSDILIAYITRVEKVGNNIFLLDINAGKVHILDDSFRYLKTFDPESCHPGVPFKPYNIVRLTESKLLISSAPIQAYVYDVNTKTCSTEEFRRSKYMGGETLSSTGDGFISYTTFQNKILEITEYDSQLNTKAAYKFSDDLPFFNLRYRMGVTNNTIKTPNGVALLNQFDLSIVLLSQNSSVYGKIDRKIIPIPFPDKKEFVRLRQDATANQIEVGNTYNAVQQLIGKHIVADIRKINDRYVFVNVSDSKNKRNLFYSCDLSFDKCYHMPNDDKGVVMFIGPNEMIKMSRSDEQLQFHRYSLR